MNMGGLIQCVTGLLESPLVSSPLVHAKLVELLMCMLRSDVRAQGSSASRALALAVLGTLQTAGSSKKQRWCSRWRPTSAGHFLICMCVY